MELTLIGGKIVAGRGVSGPGKGILAGKQDAFVAVPSPRISWTYKYDVQLRTYIMEICRGCTQILCLSEGYFAAASSATAFLK